MASPTRPLRSAFKLLPATTLIVASFTTSWVCGQATETKEEKNGEQAVIEFVTAAARGDQDAIDKALADGLDINVRTSAGSTAWHVARRRGYQELADYLVTQGADTGIPMPAADVLAEANLVREFESDSPALVVLIARAANARIEFELDNDGNVVGGTHHQGGSSRR